jgi:hypothetical protein
MLQALWALLFFAFASATTRADDTAVGAQFIGSWELVSLENRADDGTVKKPYGDHPVGRITYTADGRMSAQVMRGERQAFVNADLFGGTPEEKAAAYDGYVAYYGTFEVDSAAGVVRHHIAGSLFPNWVGGTQVRAYALDGDRLTLRTTPIAVDGQQVTAHVVWQRAR